MTAGNGQAVGFDTFLDQPLGLVEERGNHLVFRNHPHHLTLDEQMSFPATGGNTDIGFARLARPIHDAPHDRNLDGQVGGFQRGGGLLGHFDHINLGTAT